MIFFVFLFGLIVGSFLNVVILRFNTGKTLGGRSICFSCQKKLAWYELLPVVSFIMLRGKCRTCSSKISWQYPLVELLTGLSFSLVYVKFFGCAQLFALDPLFILNDPEGFMHLVAQSLYHFVISALLIVIFAYDGRHKIIPDFFVYTFTVLAGISLFFNLSTMSFALPELDHVIAGPVLFLPFFCLWYFSKGAWMGLGDGKLAWGIGWYLGLSSGTMAVMLAFWIGAIVSLTLLFLGFLSKHPLFRRYSLFQGLKALTIKSEIPFGPFLIIGVWVSFMVGEQVWNTFFSL
jgi:prepilin signal peptidase PulO-like enzyme (type II secretory pathway)